MKLADKTLAEIVEGGYSWDDFEPREEAIKALPDYEATRKIEYLDEKAENSLLDIESLGACEFHSLALSSYARLAYAGGSCDWNDRALGAIDYDRSYEGAQILIEVMTGICAVYLKDYEFGYIKPFGECLYTDEDFEGDGIEDASIEIRAAMKLERDIRSGKIDLRKELFDYYHDIPETAMKILGDSLNDLVTVQEAAEALGVSTARVKKMVSDGVLDGFKCEGRLRISKAAVEHRKSYIAEHGKPTRGKARK